MSTITPLANLVLATADKAETKTSSGIYLPEGAQEKPKTATVESVGPMVVGVKKGDKIIYESFSGTEVKHGGTDYVLVREDKVLAVVGQ
ncbi:MAG: co-chaperone GroES [Patescibacteria group bacterium]